MRRRMLLICCGFGLLATSHFGWKLTARTAYESADYVVIESDGPIEIRQYPELMLATTPMRFQAQGRDGSFMRLFRYISGANDQQQKVAMTTPVFMERATDSANGQMGFMIPQQISAVAIPEPKGSQVQIRKRAAGNFAVIRFAGRINEQLVKAKEQELRDWMSEQGIVGEPVAEIAGYDPPWTPGPMRRNEILIRLAAHADPSTIVTAGK